jgi:hypothetical protein
MRGEIPTTTPIRPAPVTAVSARRNGTMVLLRGRRPKRTRKEGAATSKVMKGGGKLVPVESPEQYPPKKWIDGLL